jgi:Domain of unknown function (DUF4410)
MHREASAGELLVAGALRLFCTPIVTRMVSLTSNEPMRFSLTAAAAFLLLTMSTGCVPPPETASGHPNPIIVREFTFSGGNITLDPAFGFSLYRGAPGVPPRQRAASVGRGAAFSLADAIATQLATLGYDAIRSDTAEAEPNGRALIVTGTFRQIIEGHRRQNASVAVDVEIAYQAAGAAPTRLTAFQNSARSRPGGGVNAAATTVGRAIASYAADLARLNNWPVEAR